MWGIEETTIEDGRKGIENLREGSMEKLGRIKNGKFYE